MFSHLNLVESVLTLNLTKTQQFTFCDALYFAIFPVK